MSNMATKTFKCPRWVAALIHKAAHKQDITDGEYVRRAVISQLERDGLSADDFDFYTNQPK